MFVYKYFNLTSQSIVKLTYLFFERSPLTAQSLSERLLWNPPKNENRRSCNGVIFFAWININGDSSISLMRRGELENSSISPFQTGK